MLAGALLLLATAAIHATGCQMIAGWLSDLGPQQRYGLQLVWLTDSLSWFVVALLWLGAAWRPDRSWRAAGLMGALIPLLTGAGILLIDPTFFGGYLLLISGGLGAIGAALARAAEPSTSG